jgi:hypothetical protein
MHKKWGGMIDFVEHARYCDRVREADPDGFFFDHTLAEVCVCVWFGGLGWLGRCRGVFAASGPLHLLVVNACARVREDVHESLRVCVCAFALKWCAGPFHCAFRLCVPIGVWQGESECDEDPFSNGYLTEDEMVFPEDYKPA